MKHLRWTAVLIIGFVAFAAADVSRGEPYLAVFEGLQCSACHTQPAGGGKRNAYGNVFAQTQLAARRIGPGGTGLWTGALTERLGIGANLRGRYEGADVPGSETRNEFAVTRGTVYFEANLIPNRLSLYIDQQIAPAASQNREAYALLGGDGGKWHLMAGQFYLPYGLRLQDDSAFVRRFTGINFTTPDRGVQVGYESGSWSTQLSVTNGSGGGTEIDSGKQVSVATSVLRGPWRVGASLNVNEADAGDRQMANIFAGLRTGDIAWLAEADWIRDELPGLSDIDGVAGLLEANWQYRQGQNIKLSYDYYDPDVDVSEDHRVRYSLLWEYSPIQFLQARFGARLHDGPPHSAMQNRDEWFVELHVFF